MILGRCLVHKESNFIHQLFPPSVDHSKMIVVICRAFFKFSHTLIKLLLLALRLFELSNDGILLDKLDAQQSSASFRVASSST